MIKMKCKRCGENVVEKETLNGDKYYLCATINPCRKNNPLFREDVEELR